MLVAPAERQLPHRQQGVATPKVVTGLQLLRGHRQKNQRTLVDQPIPTRNQTGIPREFVEGLVAAQSHSRNLRSRRRHLFGAKLNEVAVVDPKKDPGALDREIAGINIELHEPQVIRDSTRRLATKAQAVRL